MTQSSIKLSTSLFSYACEWNARQIDLEGALVETKKVARGNGLEIIGFQSLKGFPYLETDTITEIRRLIDAYEFEPVCLASNTDVAIHQGRLMSVDEIVAYVEPQLVAANKLGFPIARVQMTTGVEAIRKLIPVAERLDVKMGIELHIPYTVDHPSVLELRQMIETLETAHLGFIPDFGTSMRTICDALLDSFREAGVTDEMIAITQEIWHKDIPTPDKFGELHDRVAPLGATPSQIGRLNMSFSMNGRQPVAHWREIIPQSIHLHGKFYGFDEWGDEPSIDYPAILKVFAEGGYNGYLSSEYEGTAFTDAFSGFEMVEKHHALCDRILSDLEIETTQ